MKNYFLTVLLFCISFSIFSQERISKNFKFEISQPYQVYDAAKKFYFAKNDEVLTIKPWNKYVVIQKFNSKDVSLISAKEYTDFPDNYEVEGMIEAQGKYFLFYSSWSGRKDQHERLYYREVNFETGEFVNEATQIIDFEGHLAGSPKTTYIGNYGMEVMFGGFGVTDKFDILTSKDESRILIQYRKKPDVKRDTKSHDIFGIQVFDSNLDKLWANEYKMPYTERRMDALDFAIDSEGNGYILTKVFHDDSNKDKKRKKDEEPNYHIELFKLLNGSDDIKISKIELNDKFINGISLFESINDQMICAGFYSNGTKNKLGNADGMFVFNLTKQGEMANLQSHEIPVEVLNQYASKKTQRKNNKKDEKDEAEFANLKLKNLILDEDGSLILIGEQSYVVRHQNSKGRVYYTFHYNDMLVSKITASGELAWMKKLPKIQNGKPKMGQVYDTSKTYKGGMSYAYFYANGFHYLLFLDNVKNFDLELNERPAKHSDGYGGYLTAYQINDETGEVSKDYILDTREAAKKLELHQFEVHRVIRLSKNEFAIEFYKKKKEDVLVKVKVI